MFYYTLINVSL